MLRVKGVSFAYREGLNNAVENVSFDVNPGEFVVIAGPSGSGKSTLLRCCNGLIPHLTGGVFKGEVFFNDVSINGVKTRELAGDIAFVQQDPDFQSVTGIVETEIAFGLENVHLNGVAMRRRVEESLDALNIAHLRRRTMATLSGGEKQRVAIASALAMSPKMLLLDEPLAQLDPQGAEDVIAAVARLRDELGLGIVMVEHRLDRLMKELDSILLMDSGRIRHQGDAQVVFEQSNAAPVLAQIAKRRGWERVPLTVSQAKQMNNNEEVRLPAPLADDVGERLLDVREIAIAYGRDQVLDRVSFQIMGGERVAVVGRNGSGKTSLLKALTGIKKPERGAIERFGRVAYVPQNPNAMLFASSVRESIEETLRLLGDPPSVQGETLYRVDSVADEFHIADLLASHPRNLSMGQRVLAALATVAVGQPDVLLADEPTRGTDIWLQESLAETFRSYSKKGHAVVFATHDIEFVARVATRVIVLADREVIADGDVREVLSSSIFAPITGRIFPGALHPGEIPSGGS